MIVPHLKLFFPSCPWLEGAATVETRKSGKTFVFERIVRLLLIIFSVEGYLSRKSSLACFLKSNSMPQPRDTQYARLF